MRLTDVLQFKLLRRHVFFNNQYQLGRNRRVRNLKVQEALEEREFKVRSAEEVFSRFPSLPAVPAFDYEFERDDPVKAPFPNKEEHPLFHERPCWSFTDFTRYPRDIEIESALVRLAVMALSNSKLAISFCSCVCRTL